MFIILISIYAINVYTSKYIILDLTDGEYQRLVDIKTENADNLIDVNYSTLITFLQTDKTDEHAYSSSFNCVDFSLTLLHNASLQNISSGIALLDYHTICGHALNCFYTTDNGLIFIEPQTDIDKTNNVYILKTYSSHIIFAIVTYWN